MNPETNGQTTSGRLVSLTLEDLDARFHTPFEE